MSQCLMKKELYMGQENNDRYQCGEEKKEKDETGEITNKFGDPTPIKGFNPLSHEGEDSIFSNEKIVQMKAGKFHSLFLSEFGRLYSLGYNNYGQLGASSHICKTAKIPQEVFLDGLDVKQIEVGNYHSLVLSEDGRLFGFGSNL